MAKVVISSGHGLKVRGASGVLDEVDEARLVVNEVARVLNSNGIQTVIFHDDVSTSQSENLNRIVSYHNSQQRDLDVSVHFNAYQTTTKPMGTEVLYKTQYQLAERVSAKIAAAGEFTNRGPKERTDLAFLNGTNKPAILIETCFVDSSADAVLYDQNFYKICHAIAEGVAGRTLTSEPAPGPGPEPEPEPVPPEMGGGGEIRPTIKKGATGPHVEYLQTILGLPVDGDFGSMTDAQVKGFQAACGMTADGIVDEGVWHDIDELELRLETTSEGLQPDEVDVIIGYATDSPLMEYSWPNRGSSPPGYLPGMALAFAVALKWYQQDHPAAEAMARPLGHPDTDALKWYESRLAAAGMPGNVTNEDMIRHLFVLMIGLGMREASGQYYEGRDQSASNVESDTCEAGLFQTSWNIRSADPSIPPLMDTFWYNPNGFLDPFRDRLSPNATDLSCYGSSSGAKYQFMAKFTPLFAVFVTAVGLRTRRQHWGPINRYEVTLNEDANELLKQVQQYIKEGGEVPVPGPEPEKLPVKVKLVIDAPPNVEVTVTVVGPNEEPLASGQGERHGIRGRR